MKTVYVLLFVILVIPSLIAQVPRTISYQGVLTDNSGNPKPDGDYMLTFNLYDAETGGNSIWRETKTLNLSKGLFSTSLGDQTPFGIYVKFDKPYWLGITVGNEPELMPRIALTSVGYSLTADNVSDGKVVKSLNGLKDDLTIEGGGGTTVSSNGNTITITGGGSSGTGIQGIQNTNSTLDISNPNGPTATVNVKVPLTLRGSTTDYLLKAINTGNGHGIMGQSTGVGVYGLSDNYYGVYGNSPGGAGVVGTSNSWVGVYGESNSQAGVWGKSATGTGVYAESTDGYGMYAKSINGQGLHSESNTDYGIVGITHGSSAEYAGVYGGSTNLEPWGMLGSTCGVLGDNGSNSDFFAGYFHGDVYVTGDLSVSGTKDFKIDDPLDPANKYLIHSCVESPDRMNIYNGNITTDASGSAMVELPGYFEVLNIDYRYQLTIIGQFAQAMVENKIQNNHFTIKTDKPNVEVSWQVTGVRNDPYAKQNPFVVEKEKESFAKGKYLSPELYGQPEEMRIGYVKNPYAVQK